jgi:hypothetical protein
MDGGQLGSGAGSDAVTPARFRLLFVAGLATFLALALAVAMYFTPRVAPEPVAPPIVLPPGEPVMGALSEEERVRLLDRLQEAEEERFGVEEATRRRRLREQLLDQRAP